MLKYLFLLTKHIKYWHIVVLFIFWYDLVRDQYVVSVLKFKGGTLRNLYGESTLSLSHFLLDNTLSTILIDPYPSGIIMFCECQIL